MDALATYVSQNNVRQKLKKFKCCVDTYDDMLLSSIIRGEGGIRDLEVSYNGLREKGKDLTRSCNKRPYTDRKNSKGLMFQIGFCLLTRFKMKSKWHYLYIARLNEIDQREF